MACGTPIVATATTAIPEIMGDAGVLVPVDDGTALPRAIERVARDASLRATLRARGLLRVARFTWSAAAAATAQVYRQLAEAA